MPLLKDEVFGLFIDQDGTRTELNREQRDAVRVTLRLIQGGKATEVPDPWLTTGQAAEELGVSRRTLTRILEAGKIPFERYGKGHRRIRMSDVLRYKEDESTRRRGAYQRLNELYFDNGMDALDSIEAYLEQFE